MRKRLLLLCILVAVICISACSDEQDPNVLKVNKSSDEIIGENYQTVIPELKEAGFTNIDTKELDDLITGWLTKDGEIEEIKINGKTEFGANDSFKKDSKVVITYHTFSKEEKGDTEFESADKKRSKTVEPTDEKGSKTAEQAPDDTSEKSNQDMLTVQNNEDLAAVLAVKDSNDPLVAEFAKKYAGKTIVFDGNISSMAQHESYKTRYGILINVGDYSKTTAVGPSFKFEDVSILDLNLTGSDIPDSIGMGQNLRITAVVEEYNEDSGLFFLDPISTEIR